MAIAQLFQQDFISQSESVTNGVSSWFRLLFFLKKIIAYLFAALHLLFWRVKIENHHCDACPDTPTQSPVCLAAVFERVLLHALPPHPRHIPAQACCSTSERFPHLSPEPVPRWSPFPLLPKPIPSQHLLTRQGRRCGRS